MIASDRAIVVKDLIMRHRYSDLHGVRYNLCHRHDEDLLQQHRELGDHDIGHCNHHIQDTNILHCQCYFYQRQQHKDGIPALCLLSGGCHIRKNPKASLSVELMFLFMSHPLVSDK